MYILNGKLGVCLNINLAILLLQFLEFSESNETPEENVTTHKPPTEGGFQCTAVGKFPDPLDPHRYHQCFYLMGMLTYLHNSCPVQTCYDVALDYCHIEACKSPPGGPTSPKPKGYKCKGKTFDCKKPGILGNPEDPTIYFKCIKSFGKYKFACYTCNKKHKTCYSEKYKACIPCDGSIEGGGSGEGGDPNTPKTVTYDCDGYDNKHLPCDKLGIGLHGFPGDLSVYMECNKNRYGQMEGKCNTCPRKGDTCFVEKIDQCIERCGKGSPHKPYNCSTYTERDVQCGGEGLSANNAETSVFFNCVKKGSKWEAQCFTCSNGKTRTCFSEVQQACVTYTGNAGGRQRKKGMKKEEHKCPPSTVIDSGVDTPDVGTREGSLTWDCGGYNEGSFPCDKYGEDTYETPADASVYFTCKKGGGSGGGWEAVCHSCPSESWSCYDGDKDECVRDCVPRRHMSHDCRTYDKLSYPCTQPGYFANPNDTSVYFQCVYKDGRYESYCYACSSNDPKTCFDGEVGACVGIGEGGSGECGTMEMLETNPDKGDKESGLSYSKEGYSEVSFPCKWLGEGEWDKPGDRSVWVVCGDGGDSTEFMVCPRESKSCWDREEKRCKENCGREVEATTVRPVPSYSCGGVVEDFICEREGLFAYPKDTSVYIKCSGDTQDGSLKGICFACNEEDNTCFEEGRGGCVKVGDGESCGEKGNGTGGGGGEGEPHLSYKCEGYTEMSFDCGGLGVGFFGVPGDKSVFVECYMTPEGDLVGRCFPCKEELKGCYDDEKKVCVKNCGKGELHKPYNCSTYQEDGAYPCSKEGIFANSLETSVYFECRREGEGWRSFCYACSSENRTCYSEKKKGCVGNKGEACGNTTKPVSGGGGKEESLTHSCGGYSNDSFPCGKLGEGEWRMPGDLSVFWRCFGDGSGECISCPKGNNTCYVPEKKECVERCGRGPAPKPYNCTGYTKETVKCKKEGLYPNPWDTSVFFRCAKVAGEKKGDWVFDCFTCNSRNKTCFDEVTQECVYNRGLPCGGKTAEVHKTGEGGESVLIAKNASRTYSCVGYEGFRWDCRNEGNFTFPGDKSIYYWCQIGKDGGTGKEVLLPYCHSCGRQHKGCFIEKNNKCVDNCGHGPMVNGTVRPYDCSGYGLTSFPCKKEGLHGHPKDDTVFFNCVKNQKGIWESRCYSCNSLSRSCYKSHLKRCMIGCTKTGLGTGGEVHNGTNELGEGGEKGELQGQEINEENVYGDNCRGYNYFAVPCGSLTAKLSLKQVGAKIFYEHFGDPAVYFHCIQMGLVHKAFCYMCPLSSCFDQKKQDCVEDCKDYKPIDPSDPIAKGPVEPYDCRFYTDDSYPCTEEGYFGNPLDSSIYYHCVETKDSIATWKSICYTCHSKFGTCFDQEKRACMFVEEGCECGKAGQANSTGNGNTYDCSGYEPLKSLPCSRVGFGSWPIGGDKSVYFSCENDEPGSGKCHTCSKERMACFDAKKGKCVDHCILMEYKPYSCEIYNEHSFRCEKEGVFAQLFDSSTFFRCVKSGKYYKPLCYTCNSHLKTCFSNKAQVCVTKGGAPCGGKDPYDALEGGTVTGSKHHTCVGYNELSFPCRFYRAGKFETPADQSIYFSCVKEGHKWVAKCEACEKEDNSCFDKNHKICVPNCGKGPHKPYDCQSYDFKAIECKSEGYFMNPRDHSVFFKCVKVNSKVFPWKTWCYSCNSKLGTCFDNEKKACLTNEGQPCKQITGPGPNSNVSGEVVEPVKGEVEESRSYDCDGYNDLSIPCELHGPGRHVMPADLSVYFECVVVGGKLVAECNHCDSGRRECFVDKQQKCVENCGRGPQKPYDCFGRKFRCVHEGLFPDPRDTSIFFKCVKMPDGKIESQCFTCSGGPMKTCFSVKKQVCLWMRFGNVCGSRDVADEDPEVTECRSRTWSCAGYTGYSFPCDKYAKYGMYWTPAEKSVFFECRTKNIGGVELPWAKCWSCTKESDSNFDVQEGRCLQNRGRGPHKPYDCYTYFPETAYHCEEPGYFANPRDSSVFFKCVKKGEFWEAHCYSCSKTNNTCYSQSQQACVTIEEGKDCAGGDPFVANKDKKVGTEESSRTWSCEGYNEWSFPCEQHSPGEYGHPGDKSVYFKCEKQEEKFVANCQTCDCETKGCFDNTKGVKKCVENCLKGPAQPYECATYNPKDVIEECKRENSYIGHPKDNSVFFKCVVVDGEYSPVCYACNFNKGTCFSKELGSCVDPGKGEKCDGVDPIEHGYVKDLVKNSRTYDPDGYRKTAFPCAYKGKGDHGFPGDLSVYVTCQNKLEKRLGWEATFKVCGSRENESYYDVSTHSCKDVAKTTPAPPKLQVCKLPYATCQRVTGADLTSMTSRPTPDPQEPDNTTKKPKKTGKPKKKKEFKSFG